MAMAATLSSSSFNLFKNVKAGASRPKTRGLFLSITASTYSFSHDSLLLQAAKHTVDAYIRSGMIIGLGFGQASDLAIQYLGRQLRSGALKDIVGIPMSIASASEAAKAGIPLDSYQENSQIDFAFDDADVMEEGTLVAVIGRRKSQDDDSIMKQKLNWMEIAEEIDDLFLGDAEVWRRPSIGDAGPMGGDFPLLTREGHNVLDLIFTSPIQSLAEIAENLNQIHRVVDHGLISKFPCTAVIASESGLRVVNNQQSAVEEGL